MKVAVYHKHALRGIVEKPWHWNKYGGFSFSIQDGDTDLHSSRFSGTVMDTAKAYQLWGNTYHSDDASLRAARRFIKRETDITPADREYFRRQTGMWRVTGPAASLLSALERSHLGLQPTDKITLTQDTPPPAKCRQTARKGLRMAFVCDLLGGMACIDRTPQSPVFPSGCTILTNPTGCPYATPIIGSYPVYTLAARRLATARKLKLIRDYAAARPVSPAMQAFSR